MSVIPEERSSYAQRRELFKNIWNATMLLDDGDASGVKIKPQVIKTLRLERSSHEKASVRKKRLKNLRTVCNKILAFCDHQEQDDLFYNHSTKQTSSSRVYAEKNLVEKTSKTKKKKMKMKKVKKSLPPSKAKDFEIKNRNIGDPAVVPVERARKRVKRAIPMAKATVPMVSSQITSKLTSTRSPLCHTSSQSPNKHQIIIKKKSSAKKKKSTDI